MRVRVAHGDEENAGMPLLKRLLRRCRAAPNWPV
jgi:hypothetical protein